MEDLSAAGLNPTEAKCYRTLLTQKSWLPSELAKSVNETRTNVYKILDKLTELGLAVRLENDKKLQFRAANPARLVELAHEARAQREQAEKNLELQAQDLMKEYVKVHEQAGVRYFQGLNEITQIFNEISRAKSEVRFIHSRSGDDYYGFKEMHNLRMLAVNNGVSRKALTPDTDIATSDYKTFDPTVLLTRTWMRQEDYDAPVEWGTYDDKLYIINYGEDALGITLQSQPIADSFRKIFKMLERGQRAQPWYDGLPRNASIPGVNAPELN